MRKTCFISLFVVFVIALLTSCLPLFSVVEPDRTIEIYNPTTESVQITCYSFDATEPTKSSIPALSKRTYKLASYVCRGKIITIFEEGTYFYNTSEKVTIVGENTSVKLQPNCSYIKIVNRTSSTISSVRIGTNYVNCNPVTLSYASSTILPGGTGSIRCTNSFSGYVEFNCNNSFYRTTSTFFSPSFGNTLTINIYPSSIWKNY